MSEMLQAYWPIIVVALLIGIAVAWYIFVATRKTRVETDTTDVLDDGKGPAGRNQALIDAAPAATVPVSKVEAVAEPVVTPTAPPAPGSADDLTRIKGLGPKLRDLLATLGVTRFEQIAAWTSDDIAEIDSKLGRFEGRIERDNWVAQAKYLAADDMAGFEGQFGRL